MFSAAHWKPTSIPHLWDLSPDIFLKNDTCFETVTLLHFQVHFSQIGWQSKPLKCALSVSNETSDLLNGRVIVQVLRLLDAFAFDRFQVLSKKGASPSLETASETGQNRNKYNTLAIKHDWHEYLSIWMHFNTCVCRVQITLSRILIVLHLDGACVYSIKMYIPVYV